MTEMEIYDLLEISEDRRHDLHLRNLVQFKEEHGHVDLTVKTHVNGINTGTWLCSAKTRARNDTINADLRRQLEIIGVDFSAINFSWNEMFDALRGFRDEYNHVDVPEKFMTEEGNNLHTWLMLQKRRMRHDQLTTSLAEKLQALGVIPEKGRTDAIVFIERLAEYKAVFDTSIKSYYVTEDGICLGSWLSKLRKLHAEGKSDLNVVSAVIKLGFSMETVRTTTDEYIAALKDYRTENKSLPSTTFVSKDGINLGRWLSSRRTQSRRGKLSLELKRKLAEIDVHLPYGETE